MKNTKRFISLFLSLLLLMGAVAVSFIGAFADNASNPDDFIFDSSGHAIIGYNGPGGEVVIPEQINGNIISNIAGDGFAENTTITSVVIPDSVTTIWGRGFKDCTSLESVTIGSGLEMVDSAAFLGCDNLKDVYFTGTVAQWCVIEFGGLECANPVEITHKLYINGEEPTNITAGDLEGVEKVGEAAFKNLDSLESIELPEGVETIRIRAFCGCSNLKSAVIPLSVTKIENDAFDNCSSLTDVYYAGSAEDWNKIKFDDYGNDWINSVNIHYAIVHATGISLDETNITIAKGATQELTAALTPDNATDTVTWSSSDESIATVNGNNDGTATVTAVECGSVTITAAVDGTEFSDTCTVNIVCPHENKTEIPAKDATCTEPGNNKYYFCNDCGKYLKADGTTETTEEAETNPARGHSFPSMYESNDTQHWRVCTRGCGTEDRENHTFGWASYDWSADNLTCTARHTCTVCGKELSETVDSTPQEIPATCYDSPKAVYTATFTKDGFDTQTKEMSYGEPAGHDWGEPTYTWAGDNSTCTATRVCTKDASHKEEETVTAAVTTTATCTEAGITTYTATFENAAFEVQRKEVAVDALGHNWDTEWSYDENGHYHKCLNSGCTERKDEVAHSGGKATCTEKAACEVCGQAYGNALGHDYIDHPAKKPTATEIGWDAYKTCSRCDYTTYVEKPATGKTEETKPADDKPAAKAAIAIKGDEKAEVKYGGNITFTAEAENIPEKGKIVWYVNGEKAGEGEKFEAKNAEKDYKVQAKILDKSGNEVAKSKEVSVKVTYTFFDRIVIFFKDLFAKITAIFKK